MTTQPKEFVDVVGYPPEHAVRNRMAQRGLLVWNHVWWRWVSVRWVREQLISAVVEKTEE